MRLVSNARYVALLLLVAAGLLIGAGINSCSAHGPTTGWSTGATAWE